MATNRNGMLLRTNRFMNGLSWTNRYFSTSTSGCSAEPAASALPSKPLDMYMLRIPSFATPFEAVYSNICAMKHRLSLWTNLRMRRQLEIDSSELYSIGSNEMKWQRAQEAQLCFQRHIAVVQGVPNAALGVNRVVTLSFNPDNLFPENRNAVHAVRLLCGHRYSPFTNMVTIKADRFPFQEQNRKFLRDTIYRLKEAAMKHAEEYKDIPLKENVQKKVTQFSFPDALAKELERKNNK